MRRFSRPMTIVAAVWFIAIVAVVADWWTAYPKNVTRRYVGRNSCAECHTAQVESWRGSHHDLAMDHATPENVLGNFDDQTFTYAGTTSRMFRRDDKFYMTTDGSDGELETFEIKYTFGFDPLQQYLVELEDGYIQALPIAWDIKNERWFHLYPDEEIDYTDPLHWTRGAQNWNYMCAECHSTNLRKDFDLTEAAYHTKFSEIDVSCEACHGPGSLHIELADSRSLFWDRVHGYGLARLKQKDNRAEIETCARCHSRRRVLQDGYHPGDPFLDYYAPRLINDENLYFADGQIRDEVYVYGSYLQSRMFRENVRCTDCHDPHSANLKFTGNRLCTQCHVPAKYDAPAHHHHKPDTKGASCVECHMPERTYMVVDPRRDHSIRIPRPDVSVDLETPNACNECHDDKSAQWAADAVAEWFPSSKYRGHHYGYTIADGRARKPEAIEPLVKLARRKDEGPIVRASAVALLGNYEQRAAREAVDEFLTDDDTIVRATAVSAFERRNLADRGRHLPALLDDDRFWVRTEAARLLSPLDSRTLNSEELALLDQVLEEYAAGQMANADQPGAHLNLGVLHENQNRVDRAIESYNTALRLDPAFTPVRHNLAMLYEVTGQPAAAEEQFRELLRQDPDDPQATYSLALVVAADRSRLDEAAALLAEAVRLDPTRPRIRYNYGLALEQLGRFDEAERQLREAVELDPQSADLLYALAGHYLRRGELPAAAEYVERMLNVAPSDQRAIQLKYRIQEQMAAGAGPKPPAIGPSLPSGR